MRKECYGNFQLVVGGLLGLAWLWDAWDMPPGVGRMVKGALGLMAFVAALFAWRIERRKLERGASGAHRDE